MNHTVAEWFCDSCSVYYLGVDEEHVLNDGGYLTHKEDSDAE